MVTPTVSTFLLYFQHVAWIRNGWQFSFLSHLSVLLVSNTFCLALRKSWAPGFIMQITGSFQAFAFFKNVSFVLFIFAPFLLRLSLNIFLFAPNQDDCMLLLQKRIFAHTEWKVNATVVSDWVPGTGTLSVTASSAAPSDSFESKDATYDRT